MKAITWGSFILDRESRMFRQVVRIRVYGWLKKRIDCHARANEGYF